MNHLEAVGLFYSALAVETLCLSPAVPNAFTVPKVIALLCSAAVLAPFLAVSRKSTPILFVLQFGVLAICTILSLNPQVSFWGGDWRRMGLITWAAILVAAEFVPLAVGSSKLRWTHFLRFVTRLRAYCVNMRRSAGGWTWIRYFLRACARSSPGNLERLSVYRHRGATHSLCELSTVSSIFRSRTFEVRQQSAMAPAWRTRRDDRIGRSACDNGAERDSGGARGRRRAAGNQSIPKSEQARSPVSEQ